MHKIGYYIGSFDPFHVGHHNIYTKSLEIFDTVYVYKGKNRNKTEVTHISDILTLPGLASELFVPIDGVKKFMIRGLRNVSDVQYEDNYRKTLNAISPYPIPFIYIFCDPQYDFISSSMIRELLTFDKDKAMQYVRSPRV